MCDDSSAIYQRARTAGISDSFARHFADNLQAFKQVIRKEETAVRVLHEAAAEYFTEQQQQ